MDQEMRRMRINVDPRLLMIQKHSLVQEFSKHRMATQDNPLEVDQFLQMQTSSKVE